MDPSAEPWLPPLAPQPRPGASGPRPAAAPRTGIRRFPARSSSAALALLKWGKALLLLLPKAKLLTTSASMLVSVAAYALIWGWSSRPGSSRCSSSTRWATTSSSAARA